MCLDTVTDMNETFNTVTGDKCEVGIDLNEKHFHNALSDYNN